MAWRKIFRACIRQQDQELETELTEPTEVTEQTDAGSRSSRAKYSSFPLPKTEREASEEAFEVNYPSTISEEVIQDQMKNFASDRPAKQGTPGEFDLKVNILYHNTSSVPLKCAIYAI